MKRIAFTTAVAAMFVVATFGSAPARAAGKCERPQGVGEQRACAMAAQGNETLRRFVERTRPIYTLYYFDFAHDEPQAAASAAPAQVAAASQGFDPAAW